MDLVDVSNGLFTGKRDLGDGFTQWDWQVQYPINNYSVSLNIGQYVHFADRLGGRSCRLSDPVLIAKETRGLRIEYLKGRAVRLLEDLSPVLRVGVVAEVSPLIHKALPIRVHDDAQRIGVLLVQIADPTVAVRRSVQVPGDRVTAAPVAARCGSGLKRHPNAVAGVELRSAYLRVLPARTQMLLAHLRIRLEPTAGEHDRLSDQPAAADFR